MFSILLNSYTLKACHAGEMRGSLMRGSLMRASLAAELKKETLVFY